MADEHGFKRLRIRHVLDKQTKERHMFSDICAVSIQDFPFALEGKIIHILIRSESESDFAVTAEATYLQQPGSISFSKVHRAWCCIGDSQEVTCQQFRPSDSIIHLELKVSWALEDPAKRAGRPLNVASLTKLMRGSLDGHVLAPEQQVLLRIEQDGNAYPILLRIIAITTDGGKVDESETEHQKSQSTPLVRGLFSQHSLIHFSSTTIDITPAESSPATDTVLRYGMLPEDLGIGGLDTEFRTILRRALASRTISRESFESLGIKHVRGILLYGPPGTGKTLIARKIGQVLNAHEPKIVNGPDIMNRFVGQSEANLREIFSDAQEEYSKSGSGSRLHLIVFDELDAICKSRGSEAGGGARVGDSMVNQLLAILDGVNQLENILVIGTTNRKDMIDEALLRPGRLEILVEIGLPDKDGRDDILKIHTKKMKEFGSLPAEVSLERIAELTENFSGAELAGVVNSATAHAINRWLDARGINVGTDVGPVILTNEDFALALKDIQPAHGRDNLEIERLIQWGVIVYAPWIEDMLEKCCRIADTVKTDGAMISSSILLHGCPGSGVSALAVEVARRSGFPFIQLISPQRLARFGTDSTKIAYINSILEKASRSKSSVIILDNLTALVGWNSLGPVFSNNLLLTLEAHIQGMPPKGHRRLFLATTSDYEACEKLGLLKSFGDCFQVHPVTTVKELKSVLLGVGAFDQTIINEICDSIEECEKSKTFQLGIKDVLMCWAKSSRYTEETVGNDVSKSGQEPIGDVGKTPGAGPQVQENLTSQRLKYRKDMFVKMLLNKIS